MKVILGTSVWGWVPQSLPGTFGSIDNFGALAILQVEIKFG
jgi:hypothetical protein